MGSFKEYGAFGKTNRRLVANVFFGGGNVVLYAHVSPPELPSASLEHIPPPPPRRRPGPFSRGPGKNGRRQLGSAELIFEAKCKTFSVCFRKKRERDCTFLFFTSVETESLWIIKTASGTNSASEDMGSGSSSRGKKTQKIAFFLHFFQTFYSKRIYQLISVILIISTEASL